MTLRWPPASIEDSTAQDGIRPPLPTRPHGCAARERKAARCSGRIGHETGREASSCGTVFAAARKGSFSGTLETRVASDNRRVPLRSWRDGFRISGAPGHLAELDRRESFLLLIPSPRTVSGALDGPASTWDRVPPHLA